MWNEDSLNEMFLQRIINYKPNEVTINLDERTNSIFDVRYVRHGATSFKHIIRRSFLRPRDIIIYINKINEVHIETKSGLFSSKDLYEAEKEYSVSIYNELIDEWVNQMPYVSELLSILQNIGFQTFSYSDFAKKYILAFPEREKY
ncbi:P-loop ATPase, Sll1717 family [Bacillus swezeyi]|uniref:P-loop ATPase, Sll1717 family n=1 Tax=Bacillus swezeyi TaxID=1925020 RepID=UPI003F8BCD71